MAFIKQKTSETVLDRNDVGKKHDNDEHDQHNDSDHSNKSESDEMVEICTQDNISADDSLGSEEDGSDEEVKAYDSNNKSDINKGRTGGPGKFDEWVGEDVRIYNGRISVISTVVAVRHYPDLGSYLEGEGWEHVAPHTGSALEAVCAYRAVKMEDGTRVFSVERVAARGGIWAIAYGWTHKVGKVMDG